MKEYTRARVYLDENYRSQEQFTVSAARAAPGGRHGPGPRGPWDVDSQAGGRGHARAPEPVPACAAVLPCGSRDGPAESRSGAAAGREGAPGRSEPRLDEGRTRGGTKAQTQPRGSPAGLAV